MKMKAEGGKRKDEVGSKSDIAIECSSGAQFILHPSSFILGLAAGIAAMLLCIAATAQPYPSRPVRLVVPAAPGGAIDVVGRIVGQKLTELLGQNVVIDNRAGANNIIGTEIVARSPADGYTLLTTAGSHTINPAVYRKLRYSGSPVRLRSIVTTRPSIHLKVRIPFQNRGP